MPELNDWNVPYSVIKFFATALDGHSKVAWYKRTDDIYFTIAHTNGSRLNVLLVNEYSLGLAAVLRAKAEFHDVEYIVTGGNWNGYTPEREGVWQEERDRHLQCRRVLRSTTLD